MIIPVFFNGRFALRTEHWKDGNPGNQSEPTDLNIISTCLVSYLSKLTGLGLLTRRLCSRLIDLHASNITAIISEQIVKRFYCNNLAGSAYCHSPMYRSSELLQSRQTDSNCNLCTYKVHSLPIKI